MACFFWQDWRAFAAFSPAEEGCCSFLKKRAKRLLRLA
jgi:hypothetical protein